MEVSENGTIKILVIPRNSYGGGAQFEIVRAKYWYVMVTTKAVA